MCCIDGNVGTVRETGVEIDCVTDLWSSDPDDYTVLGGSEATPDVLRTTSYENYRTLKIQERDSYKTDSSSRMKVSNSAIKNKSKSFNKFDRGNSYNETLDVEMADESTIRMISKALKSCRVLHFCAGKISGKDKIPALYLSPEDPESSQGTKQKNIKTKLYAQDIVGQMYLKNCALCE
jgi:hypothetical protein